MRTEVSAAPRIQVVERTGVGARALARADDGEAAARALARHIGGHARTKGNELRYIIELEASRNAPQLESSTLCEVDGRAIGVERIHELVEHRV